MRRIAHPASGRALAIVAGVVTLVGTFFLGVAVGRRSMKQAPVSDERAGIEAAHLQVPPSGASRLEEFKTTLGAAAEKLNAEERKPLLAAQQLVASIQPQMAEYEATLRELGAADFVAPASIKSEEDLRARGALVQRFDAANEALATYFKNAEPNYRAALNKMGVAENLKEGVLQGFRRGGNFDLNLKIHDANRQLAASMQEMLKLLSREWGAWRTNDRHEVIFDHEDAVKEFETIQGQLTTAAAHHEAAEKELLARAAKSKKP